MARNHKSHPYSIKLRIKRGCRELTERQYFVFDEMYNYAHQNDMPMKESAYSSSYASIRWNFKNLEDVNILLLLFGEVFVRG